MEGKNTRRKKQYKVSSNQEELVLVVRKQTMDSQTAVGSTYQQHLKEQADMFIFKRQYLQHTRQAVLKPASLGIFQECTVSGPKPRPANPEAKNR